jgi:hypothetical protein
MNGYDKAEQLAKDSLQEARDRGFNSNTPYDDHKFRDIIRMKVERLLAQERENSADRAYEYVCDMGQGLAIAQGVREAVLNPSEKK